MIRSTPILWFRDDIDPVVEFYTHALGDVREVTRMTYPEHSWFVDIAPSLSNATMAAFLSVGGSPLTIIRGRSELLREEHITFTLNFQSLPATDVAEAMTKTWNKLVTGGTVIDQLTEYEGGRMYGRLTDRYGIHWNFLSVSILVTVKQFLPNILRRSLNFLSFFLGYSWRRKPARQTHNHLPNRLGLYGVMRTQDEPQRSSSSTF